MCGGQPSLVSYLSFALPLFWLTLGFYHSCVQHCSGKKRMEEDCTWCYVMENGWR